MKGPHTTVTMFRRVLIVSIAFYFTSGVLASPLTLQQAEVKPAQPIEVKQRLVYPPAIAAAPSQTQTETQVQARSAVPVAEPAASIEKGAVQGAPARSPEVGPIFAVSKPGVEPSRPVKVMEKSVPEGPQAKSAIGPQKVKVKEAESEPAKSVAAAPAAPLEMAPKSEQPMPKPAAAAPVSLAEAPAAPLVTKAKQADAPQASPSEAKVETLPGALMGAAQQAPSSPPVAMGEQTKPAPASPSSAAPVAMGGLGPLHLLATTLCSYQPDKPVADEHLNQLYARRASVRKSLFEFMSLKFTNLEKLSSRLGYGLQVVPVKSQPDNKSPSVTPSHGWPVVGKCTAYDLKLMGEAAWCECQEGDQGCASKQPAQVVAADEQPARITSNQHVVSKAGRSIPSTNSFLPSSEESSVISKLLHVSDIKDAPTVETTIYNLNLTQHQLATLEAHATSTLECRRNALRYSKALFNHLAEDQREVSESWPRLYALISNDDCARKRIIDIFNALSGFRTDTTSIRRDNLEFAFAMDDLRAKVLESEVNVPLTFDRHFIEVEQFLQQSVRLMLANIQPKRAKLTSMRYRSLMYGASQQEADDQCIDLHQRLLARNYPNDCNPTQFGQLPDSLRMTASSLELWSIEKELSLHTAKVADYPNSSAVGQQKVKENVNECIANLVSS